MLLQENKRGTKKKTKLLLELYIERKNKFRDTKIKKKALWTETVAEMKSAGYGFTEDMIDRK